MDFPQPECPTTAVRFPFLKVISISFKDWVPSGYEKFNLETLISFSFLNSLFPLLFLSGESIKEIIFSAAETPVIATWKSEVNVLIGIKNSGANININNIGNKPKLPFKNNLTEVIIASIVPA